MATIPGSVRLGGFIAPSDSADTYAVHDEFYGRGGYRSVDTIANRDAITSDRRKAGMLVNVYNDSTPSNNKIWELGSDLSTWTEFSVGGSAETATLYWSSADNFQTFETANSTVLHSGKMVTIELVDGAGSYTWNDKGSIYRHTNNRTLKAKAEVFLTIQTGVELNSIFNLGENINCFIQGDTSRLVIDWSDMIGNGRLWKIGSGSSIYGSNGYAPLLMDNKIGDLIIVVEGGIDSQLFHFSGNNYVQIDAYVYDEGQISSVAFEGVGVPLDSVNITVEPNTWTGDTMFTTPQTFFTGFDGTVNVYTYQTAAKTTYDDSLTSLSATNVQTAIQALNTKIDSMGSVPPIVVWKDTDTFESVYNTIETSFEPNQQVWIDVLNDSSTKTLEARTTGDGIYHNMGRIVFFVSGAYGNYSRSINVSVGTKFDTPFTIDGGISMQVAVNAGEALFSNFNTALVLKGENSSLYNAGLGYMFDERYTGIWNNPSINLYGSGYVGGPTMYFRNDIVQQLGFTINLNDITSISSDAIGGGTINEYQFGIVCSSGANAYQYTTTYFTNYVGNYYKYYSDRASSIEQSTSIPSAVNTIESALQYLYDNPGGSGGFSFITNAAGIAELESDANWSLTGAFTGQTANINGNIYIQTAEPYNVYFYDRTNSIARRVAGSPKSLFISDSEGISVPAFVGEITIYNLTTTTQQTISFSATGYPEGQKVRVYNPISAQPVTLVTSVGAFQLSPTDTSSSNTIVLQAGTSYDFIYQGGNWMCVSKYPETTSPLEIVWNNDVSWLVMETLYPWLTTLTATGKPLTIHLQRGNTPIDPNGYFAIDGMADTSVFRYITFDGSAYTDVYGNMPVIAMMSSNTCIYMPTLISCTIDAPYAKVNPSFGGNPIMHARLYRGAKIKNSNPSAVLIEAGGNLTIDLDNSSVEFNSNTIIGGSAYSLFVNALNHSKFNTDCITRDGTTQCNVEINHNSDSYPSGSWANINGGVHTTNLLDDSRIVYVWDAGSQPDFNTFYQGKGMSSLTNPVNIYMVGTGHTILGGDYFNAHLLTFVGTGGGQGESSYKKDITISGCISYGSLFNFVNVNIDASGAWSTDNSITPYTTGYRTSVFDNTSMSVNGNIDIMGAVGTKLKIVLKNSSTILSPTLMPYITADSNVDVRIELSNNSVFDFDATNITAPAAWLGQYDSSSSFANNTNNVLLLATSEATGVYFDGTWDTVNVPNVSTALVNLNSRANIELIANVADADFMDWTIANATLITNALKVKAYYTGAGVFGAGSYSDLQKMYIYGVGNTDNFGPASSIGTSGSVLMTDAMPRYFEAMQLNVQSTLSIGNSSNTIQSEFVNSVISFNGGHIGLSVASAYFRFQNSSMVTTGPTTDHLRLFGAGTVNIYLNEMSYIGADVFEGGAGYTINVYHDVGSNCSATQTYFAGTLNIIPY